MVKPATLDSLMPKKGDARAGIGSVENASRPAVDDSQQANTLKLWRKSEQPRLDYARFVLNKTSQEILHDALMEYLDRHNIHAPK